MSKFVFAVAAVAMAGAATAFTTAPAMAGAPHAKTETVVIDASAFNVDTEAGYQALAGRIDRAVREVCGEIEPRELSRAPEVRACQASSRADAMEQLEALASGRGSVTIVASR